MPDLPGCFIAGDSYEEALANAREAIECYIEGLLEDGESVPQAMSIARPQSFNQCSWSEASWRPCDFRLTGCRSSCSVLVLRAQKSAKCEILALLEKFIVYQSKP
ncbi:type II toxin-antitoxin system HicB family antitoxin [Coraliomargarita sinensis]|uniref:type II toxin-antitoxin system HicB family antitoxin n=1 Tax=Coraliomargarita sinensis TaxID=2174842 RepID=UPI0018EEBE96